MAGSSQEKRPGEIIRLGSDFSQALLSGESLVSGNITITVTNALTDADVTATIVVSGSGELSGNTVRARFQGGTIGDILSVVFSTGATNFGNVYQGSINLVITGTPAGDNLLCSLDEVKRFLKITDTSEDVLLTDLLPAATRYFQARTARTLFLSQFTEDFYLCRDQETDCVQLWEFPVKSIDSITLITADEGFTSVITDDTSYAFDDTGRLFFRHSNAFYWEPDFNRVVYRAGYAKIPEDLKQAAIAFCAVLYRGIGREGLTRERIGDYTWQVKDMDALPRGLVAEMTDPLIESVVKRYTRRDL